MNKNKNKEIFNRADAPFFLKKVHLEKLELYTNILEKWNKKINLVAKTTIRELWSRHILDSAQLMKYIPEKARIITDFGSGAGFPGMVLAILKESMEVHLIESDSRKCAFLLEVARVTETKVHIHNERIEKLEPWKSDILTARALAPINKLLGYIYNFLKKDGLCLLLKGCNVENELQEAKAEWRFDHKLHPSMVGEGEGFVVEITNLKAQDEQK